MKHNQYSRDIIWRFDIQSSEVYDGDASSDQKDWISPLWS